MKWQGYNETVTNHVDNAVFKIFKGRSLLVIASLAAVVMVAAASSKWSW